MWNDEDAILTIHDGRYSNYAKVADALASIHGHVIITGYKEYEERAVRLAILLWKRDGMKVRSLKYTEKGKRVWIVMEKAGEAVDQYIIR